MMKNVIFNAKAKIEEEEKTHKHETTDRRKCAYVLETIS